MKLSKIVGLLFLLGMISGCNEYEKIMAPALKIKLADSNPNPVFDGEVEPSIPNRAENDKTILGIDSNKNGIRDDIDIWINRTALDYNERMAMRQYAKAYQYKIKVSEMNLKDEATKAVQGVADASVCISTFEYLRTNEILLDKEYDLALEMQKIIFNQKSRFLNNEFYNRYGTIVSFTNPNKPYLNCKFNIVNRDEVIKHFKF